MRTFIRASGGSRHRARGVSGFQGAAATPELGQVCCRFVLRITYNSNCERDLTCSPVRHFRGPGPAENRSGCERQGTRETALTKSDRAGPGWPFESGRRLAAKDRAARGTVCRRLHQKASLPVTTGRLSPLVIRRSAASDVPRPGLSARAVHHGRKRPVRAAGGRHFQENGVAHARAPSSMPRRVVELSRLALPYCPPTRSQLVHSALATETCSSPK